MLSIHPFKIIFANFQLHNLTPSPLMRRRRQWHPTPVLLPGKSHGQRSLVGCSPWGHEESDATERLHFHFFLSCIGEGNGNPLHCSCLENPRDGGAWWAAVYGVAQSRTRLKRLSSSSKLGCQYFLAFNTLKQGQSFSVQCLYKFWEELVWLMQKVKMEDSLTWFLLQTWVVLPVFKCPKGRIKDF